MFSPLLGATINSDFLRRDSRALNNGEYKCSFLPNMKKSVILVIRHRLYAMKILCVIFIDIEGRWKMLHYYAKNFFAPIIITSHLSISNQLSIYIVSDKLHTLINCTAEIRIYKWNSMTPVSIKFFTNITVESNKAMKITSFWLDAFLIRADCGSLVSAKRSCIATLSLMDKSESSIAPENYIYPNALKNADIPLANVTMKIKENHLPGKLSNYPDFKVTLRTDNIALFVWLEAGNIHGRFSENGFHMFTEEKDIIFHAYEAITIELLQSNIRITTLSDIYNTQSNYDYDYLVKRMENLH